MSSALFWFEALHLITVFTSLKDVVLLVIVYFDVDNNTQSPLGFERDKLQMKLGSDGSFSVDTTGLYQSSELHMRLRA